MRLGDLIYSDDIEMKCDIRVYKNDCETEENLLWKSYPFFTKPLDSLLDKKIKSFAVDSKNDDILIVIEE